MMGTPSDQEWERIVPMLRSVMLDGSNVPDELMALLGFDQAVLDRVLQTITPRLKYMRGYHPMTDRMVGLGDIALAHENIAALTHAYKVWDTPISWTPPDAEFSNGGTARVWITREGQWVLAMYSGWNPGKTLVTFVCDDVQKIIETLRDVPHVLYVSHGDYSRVASIPMLLARGLQQLVEDTVEARNRDQEEAAVALRYINTAFPR